MKRILNQYIINEAGKPTSNGVPECNIKQTLDDVLSFLVSNYQNRNICIFVDSEDDFEILKQEVKEKLPKSEVRFYER